MKIKAPALLKNKYFDPLPAPKPTPEFSKYTPAVVTPLTVMAGLVEFPAADPLPRRKLVPILASPPYTSSL